MNREEQLARIADDFMRTRQLPYSWDLGMRRVEAVAHPAAPAEPREIRFAAEWPDGMTIVAARPVPPGWWA